MKISIICPFFNEELIIEKAAYGMISNLEKSQLDWELVCVNDGSTDNGLSILRSSIGNNEKVNIVDYNINQGRGYAIKYGMKKARGDILISTEIDLSWGEDIVKKIVDKFIREPDLDVVIASPNIEGGGYKNIPKYRVIISKIGNFIIRMLFTKEITMNTGMTRGYRRGIIENIQFDEKGKEFHLESLLKLKILGYKFGEIPATLEWKDKKLSSNTNKKRKSSSKVPKLILSHLRFAAFANPIRYFWSFSFFSCMLIDFLVISVIRFFNDQVAIYLVLVGIIFAVFSILLFGFGIVTVQNINILKELWRIKRRG